MKVTSSWARPIQGISQQPPKSMKEGQCREQINMIPSPVRGLEKRMGTDHTAEILATVSPDAMYHHYARGDSEEYFIITEADGVPKVFSKDGVRHTVVLADATDLYCTATTPKEALVMQTIADYTFIVNKSVVVAVAADTTPALVNEALVYLQYATYGRDYKVIINGTLAGEFKTPTGAVATDIELVDIDYIINQISFGTVWVPGQSTGIPVFDEVAGYTITLPTNAEVVFVFETVSGLERTDYTRTDDTLIFGSSVVGLSITVIYRTPATGGLSTLASYTIVKYGAAFHIKRVDGAAFEILTEDGAQGKDFIAIKDSVTGVESLPPVAPNGYLVQVKGKGKKQEDAFYVKAVNTGSDTQWVETVAPGTLYKYNAATMPHNLVRTSINESGIATFTLDKCQWTDRDVGADDSNPWSAFKGQCILSTGLFQNRLTFTSGEAVSMSRSGQFFNFFRESTQVSVADDPIDCYADSAQVNELLHSVALDGDSVYFSAKGQFLLSGAKPITKETATLKQTNTFEIQTNVAPVPTGESICFPFTNGLYTGIRELFTDNIIDTKRARPVTEHVDRFIAGKLRCMVASTDQNWLLALADSPNTIYMYNWLWVGAEKAQSAWHKWEWPVGERIEHITFSQNKIYLFISRASGVFLEVLDIGDPDSIGLPYPARLDRKHEVTATKVGNRYNFPDTFPDVALDKLEYILSTGAYPEYIGCTCIFFRDVTGLYTEDDLGAGATCALVGGVKFQSSFIPSQPVVKDFRERVIEIDTLKIAQVYLNYETTGYIHVTVQDVYGQCEVNEFNGRVFGDVNNLVGFAPLIDGQFNFPVLQEADKVTILITSDSHLPLRIRDMEFSGQFTQRGRRI